jgi:hypothetical protein
MQNCLKVYESNWIFSESPILRDRFIKVELLDVVRGCMTDKAESLPLLVSIALSRWEIREIDSL